MPRFKSNRWWTLILTLCLGFAFVVPISTPANAASLLDEIGQSNLGGGGSGPPGPPAAGDPDIPMSSCKRVLREAGARPAASVSTVRAAGDGRPVDGVMMWDFRVALQSLRLWGFLRF